MGPFGLPTPGIQRPMKGASLIDIVDNYVVLDLETTGLDPQWDEIIEVAAIRFEKGMEIERFESLVQPKYPISGFITELTGITNEMLMDADPVQVVLPSFIEFIGSSIVVGHNVNFDVHFLYDWSEKILGIPFCNDFVDTMRLSRRLFKNERHHRLIDLVTRFGISDNTEHRAMSDVELTNKCYEYMARYILENNIDVKKLFPKKDTRIAAEIKTNKKEFDETTAVYGNTFVFTGALEKMVRRDAMQIVVDMGGFCSDGVNKNTNYLVLGNNDYCKSIKDGKSNKQKKAEKMMLEGYNIQVISENVFYEMIEEGQV